MVSIVLMVNLVLKAPVKREVTVVLILPNKHLVHMLPLALEAYRGANRAYDALGAHGVYRTCGA